MSGLHYTACLIHEKAARETLENIFVDLTGKHVDGKDQMECFTNLIHGHQNLLDPGQHRYSTGHR